MEQSFKAISELCALAARLLQASGDRGWRPALRRLRCHLFGTHAWRYGVAWVETGPYFYQKGGLDYRTFPGYQIGARECLWCRKVQHHRPGLVVLHPKHGYWRDYERRFGG